jgi:hypothetical protein
MAGIKSTEFARVREELSASEARNIDLDKRLESLEGMIRGREARDFAPHESRNNETRSKELRAATLRQDFKMNYRGPLYFAPHEIPEGMEYFWVRESSQGMLDTGRVTEMMSTGWTFVPASRHPERCYVIPGQAEKSLDGCLRYKDVILMERSKELNDEDRRHFAAETQRAVRDLPGLDGLVRSSKGMQFTRDSIINETSQGLASFRGNKVEGGLSNLSFGN